jgi:excinuclease UvrABC nuclease subunit
MLIMECDDPLAWHYGWIYVRLDHDHSLRVSKEIAFPGVYMWIETEPLPTGLALYIGQSQNIHWRLSEHFSRVPRHGGFYWRGIFVRRPSLYIREVRRRRDRLGFEAGMIRHFAPRYNLASPRVV